MDMVLNVPSSSSYPGLWLYIILTMSTVLKCYVRVEDTKANAVVRGREFFTPQDVSGNLSRTVRSKVFIDYELAYKFKNTV